MQDRFKFRAIVKGYYEINLPDEYKEVEPLIILDNIDVLKNGEVGLMENDLETAIKEQYPNLNSADINYILEFFNSDSSGIDGYVTITPEVVYQCTGLKDKNGKLIYEGDIIVIPNQYPFYDYKNKEDMKQDLNSTEGEIKGESILNYIGIVEWIYSQWQYVYHCVNSKKQGISEGVNQGLNDFGFDETRNTCYEVVGNIYENPELLENK